jgi:hypothetical protein
MPVYCFKCPHCGAACERVASIHSPPPMKAKCQCGRFAVRDLLGESPNVQPDFKPYYSTALGVFDPSERRPDETYNGDNDVLVKSKSHLRQLLSRKSEEFPHGLAVIH